MKFKIDESKKTVVAFGTYGTGIAVAKEGDEFDREFGIKLSQLNYESAKTEYNLKNLREERDMLHKILKYVESEINNQKNKRHNLSCKKADLISSKY